MLGVIMSIEDDSDKEFMKNIFEKYYATMKKKAYEVTNNRNVVEDIVSEAFVHLIRHIDTVRGLTPNQRASYIMITVKNTAINYIRQSSRASEIVYVGNEEDVSDHLFDPRMEPQFILDAKMEYNELCDTIRRLPERERNLLICKYIFEMDDQAISRILKTKPNNVRQYLTRARRHAYKIILEGRA